MRVLLIFTKLLQSFHSENWIRDKLPLSKLYELCAPPGDFAALRMSDSQSQDALIPIISILWVMIRQTFTNLSPIACSAEPWHTMPTLLASVRVLSLCSRALLTTAPVPVAYDALLTMSDEVNLIWRRKFSVKALIHVMNRYAAIAAYIAGVVLLFPVSDEVRVLHGTVHVTTKFCS